MSEKLRVLLPNHSLYKGRDVDDARDVLSRLFTPVSVEPLRPDGPYSTLVNGVELPRSAICYCEYPDGMVAGPEAPLDFHTIQLSLSGAARFDSQFGSDAGDARTGIVLSAGQQMKVHHAPGNSILSFIIRDDVLRETISSWTGRARIPPLRFKPRFDPTDPRVASVLALLETAVKEIDRPGGVLESPAALASVEHTLLTFMLFGLEHNLSDALRKGTPDAGAGYVEMVEEYVEAHAQDPIDMATLARLTGQSATSLYRAFIRQRDQSPMAYVREIRIRMARRYLLEGLPNETVTRVALRCGFSHLGRFASLYKERFGESPSETHSRASRIWTEGERPAYAGET